MANLIYLRQRIKVVDTIKKTTNAMRLISMSLHSRLRHKKQYLEAYKKEVLNLARNTQTVSHEQTTKTLAILVGSQKGLCGTFNTALFSFFANTTDNIIVIGKQMAQLCALNNVSTTQVHEQFNISNFVDIATKITSVILENKYSSVVVYSNHPKTFFLQTQVKTEIWPLNMQESSSPETEYLFEQANETLSSYICQLLIKVHLQELLFSSLLAEQASRFISMDNSTRNAENLLHTMKLQYNKRRQADITRELTDLSGSLSQQ